MSKLILETDGSCRPNPGKMGVGIVIYREEILIKKIKGMMGEGTNNIAEYTALIIGLKEVKRIKKKDDKIEAHVDSQLMYKQIRGEYRIKNPKLRILNDEIMKIIKGIKDFKIIWNYRENNGVADKLAKKAICEYEIKEKEER